MDDLKLLRQYASTGSQAAFAEVVMRHLDLVYSTCVRQLRDAHAAEDAAQAVFLSLARKAPRLRDGTVVAGWLYQAARYESASAARQVRIRRKHEMAAAAEAAAAADDGGKNASTGDLATAAERGAADLPGLDRALDRLRPAERHAILLRYFQGRSFRDLALETGTSEEAARKRVSRGLEKLRTLLRPTTGGAALPAVAVEALLRASVCPAPPALAAATLKALSALPAAAAAGSLTKGALLAMALSKTKVAVVAAAVLLLAGGGGAYVAYKTIQPHREQTVVITPATTQVSDVAGWREHFNAVYGLADGQNAKLVTEMIPERQLFWDAETRNHNFKLRPGEDSLTVDWSNGVPHWGSMRGFPSNLSSAFQSGARLKGWQMADPSMPLDLPFKGDWSFRKGATTQQIMDDLASIVSARLGRPVRFVNRQIVHDVLVARGSYHFTPLPGKPNNGVVEFVGERVSSGDIPPRTETTTLAGMLGKVEDVTNMKVFDETGAGNTPLTIRDYAAFTNTDRLLENLQKQTGLQLVREKRPVDSWCMVDAQGNLTTPTPPEFDKKYGLGDGEVVKRVTGPFGPERQQFLNLTATPGKTGEPPVSILVEWDNTAHLRYPLDKPLTLQQVLEYAFGLDALTLDPATIPLGMPMDGDWVVRRGAPGGQLLAALGPILSRQLGRAVHFEKRTVPVNVLVVSGTPSSGSGMILFTNQPPGSPKSPVFRTTWKEFLKTNFPMFTHKRVIDQTSAPDAELTWQASIQGNLAPDVAIKAVTESTGLRVTQEKREMEMIVLADGPGAVALGQ